MARNGIINVEKHLLLFYSYLRSCYSQRLKPKKEKLEKWILLCKRILNMLEEISNFSDEVEK
jgi:hypothetical protein